MSLDSPTSGPPSETGRPTPERSRGWQAGAVALVGAVVAAVAVAVYAVAGSGKAPAPTTGPDQRTATVSPSTRMPTTVPVTVPQTTTTPRITTTSPAPPTTSVPTTNARSPVASPPGTGAHGPITSPPLPAPGPGFNAGQVTAVGDSVMLDYQTPLQQDIPGINVQAAVSEQWSAGEAVLQQLKSEGQLGAVVIVGLSTNGPISSADVASMMGVLSGASRVVFVNIYVDRPWQDPNNAVLAAGAQQYPNTVLADWNGLASQNPGWLYSDGTHLPIDGPGAQALANLVAAQA